MMYKTNFIALVYNDARSKVVIWDDYERRNITEISFNSDVKQVLLRKDMLVVALEEKLFLFEFISLKMIEHVETGHNPKGLCGVATDESCLHKVVAFNYPKKEKGCIGVLKYGKLSFNFKSIETGTAHAV